MIHCARYLKKRFTEGEISKVQLGPSTAESPLRVSRVNDKSGSSAKGRVFDRRSGERPKSDRLSPKVLCFVEEGRSCRAIAKELGLSKNTVMSIVLRNRTERMSPQQAMDR